MILEIETPRLYLRRWEQADLDTFAAMNAEKEVMRYYPETFSRERTEETYRIVQAEFAENNFGLYAAEEKSSGSFMGYIGFHHANLDTGFCPCVEIGWRLAKQFWNNGYATEGARACLAHGFSNLGFSEVYSFTAVANTPSQNVMRKIGMQFYEHFEHPGIPAGHPLRPHVCYVIRKETPLP